METKYIIPFIKATEQVCKEFLNIQAEAGNPELYDKNNSVCCSWDISGTIGLAGDIKGMVVISFRQELILKISSNLMQKEITEIDDEVIDIVGELVNIVAGNAKKFLEEFRIVISLPTVIKGSNHSFFPASNRVTIFRVPFKTDYGEFDTFVYIQRD